MDQLACIDDFEKVACQLLCKSTWDYYGSGADGEITLLDNKQAFKRWLIRPRMLRDVSVRNLSTTVLGKRVNFPIGIAPTALQKLAHNDGEIGNARAAESLNTIFILSSGSNISIEEVVAAAPRARKWLQLLEISVDLIQRAEVCGFEALVLTVDCPYIGKRRANVRDKFKLPKHLRMVNFEQPISDSSFDPVTATVVSQNKKSKVPLIISTVDLMGRSLVWTDIDALKRITRLPIILKGILCSEDARLAVQHGVSAIIVSNHGGRQLDTTPATIDVLEDIVREVQGGCEVYVDGGIRTGTDVFKALALGAKMVFAGRPLLWGLAVGGENGSKRVLEILREELDLTMALAGVSNVDQIDRSTVARYSSL